MSKKTKIIVIISVIGSLCIGILVGLFIGNLQNEKPVKERESLQYLNRASIEKMITNDQTVYVIGHQSPDSDTVCSAIAYANLLNKLGFKAEAAVTAKVNKETAYILKEAGVAEPPVLDDAKDKSIFLVDHSEYAQAAKGMDEAHIVGIIDHHGIGSGSTGHQVVYEAKPIGATATIIWLDYLNYGINIDKTTAYVLLGALLSDTNNGTGTTTTEADKQAIKDLAAIAGVTDTAALNAKLTEERLSYEGMTDEEIFFSDYKEYDINGVKIGIGSASALSEEIADNIAVRMKRIIPECFKKREVDIMYITVGIRVNDLKVDRIVVCDERSENVLKAAFPDYDEYDGTSYIFRTGLGRKTKFVPGLTDYLNTHPLEKEN